MKPSLVAAYALGGAGYLGSGVAGGVVSGANVIANAGVLATEMGGNQLGTTTVVAGLAGEARSEIEATVEAAVPVIQAFGANTWGATTAAGQAGVAAIDQMITAAQSGDAKAQFDILAFIKDGAQNIGAGIMAQMAKPGAGAPEVARIVEGGDGNAAKVVDPPPRISLATDGAGHHLPAVRKAEGRPFEVSRSDKDRPTLYPLGDDPAHAHWRLHDAEREFVGPRQGAFAGTDKEPMDAYRSAYENLADMRVDVRSPSGKHNLAESITPRAAVDRIETWLRENNLWKD